MRRHPLPTRSTSVVTRALAGLSLGMIALLGTACGSSATPAASSTSAASAASPAPAGSVNCAYVPSARPAAKEVAAPPAVEPATGTAAATMELTGGSVTFELDRATAPCTVGSFVHLSQAGYYDDTPCHRLTSSPSLSVLQCGDPSGSGGGGPGYSYADETNPTMVYPAGTVAMANAGPDTNGSQFFLVYADSSLPPNYTVFGTITEGLDVVQGIAAKGTTGGGPDGKPAEPVTISAVTVQD